MATITSQQRIGLPGEAGAAAAFLLSNDATIVTPWAVVIAGSLLGALAIQ